jgi:putative PEP-CTERM system TPR-repeat lipoprotein
VRSTTPIAYQEALARAPQHLLARFGMTRVLLLNNEPDAALEHISFLQNANPNNPVRNYFLALASRQKNDTPATKQALSAVLQVSPNHPASLLLMGSLHYSSNELEQAKELLSRYVNIQPDDSRGAKLLGAVLLKQKNYALALETLEGALPLAPNDSQLMALLGTANMAQRQFDKAHAFMQKAAELQPAAAAIRTQLAVSHLFAGDTDKGVAELEAAVELDPGFTRADYLLTILHLREQRFEDVLQTATHLQQNQPDNPIPINLSGAVHEGLGDTTAARADYERAIALQPSYATAQLNLARMDIADANLESAEQRFRAVLENNANNLHALSSLAQIAEAGGDQSEAVRLLEQARNAHPTAHAPRLVLARHYLSVGNNRAAVQAATEAQTLAPRDAATLLLVGQTNVAVAQHKTAENALRELVELVPDNAQYQYSQGVALANSGDRSAIRAAFERCLALDSDYAAARAALGRLSLSEGDIDAAIEIAGKLQQSFPDGAEGFLLQADALLSAKQLEDAEAAYHLAQARRPERTTIMKISTVQRALGTPDRAISTFAD